MYCTFRAANVVDLFWYVAWHFTLVKVLVAADACRSIFHGGCTSSTVFKA